ncbi:MAG: HlyD family efflux transporter periplasmic adaptor subunit, partial [Eubacteriales bacterium]|nr:HlyD family efflux transporter periplasmic adaptor subunit [Eubacteriales bacterium]
RANAPVALVFTDEADALNYKRSREIETEIELLESLAGVGKNTSSDYAAIDKQIDHDLKKLIGAVNGNNFLLVDSYSDDLVYNINQRQIITGQLDNFNTQIAELRAELSTCQTKGGTYEEVIHTEIPGYFVSHTDGYEGLYDYEKAEEMTVEQFEKELKPQSNNSNVVGKTVSGPNWYVACKLTADEAITLSHSNTSTLLSFPDASCNDIPATLVSLNQTSKQSDAVAVFRCDYMNSSISHLRDENVLITVNSYSGLRISKSAIHDDFVDVAGSQTGERKKVQGVYVLRGSELVFKEIVILYADNNFVIVDENPEADTLVSGNTVSLNDSIVVNGEDLYAGKVVR